MTTLRNRAAGWHRPLMLLVSAMAVLTVVAAVGVVADPRVLTGAPIWLKPLKFAISFVLYGVTLAWMLSLLPRRSRAAERAATVIVAMSVLEMVVIVGQVLRGTTSHFNGTTTLNAVLFDVMGVAITVLFAAQFVLAVVLARRSLPDRAGGYAVRLGLAVSLLGMLVAFPMVVQRPAGAAAGISGAHSVGVPDGGPGLPLLGWSTTGGDLRVGHFVGMHALQALPLLAILLDRFLGARLDELTRARLVLVGGAAYAGLTLLVTGQALRGQPLVAPDALTLAAAGVLVAATATATTLVLARRSRRTGVVLVG
ncbi:hypothetical protein O7630_12820 [Micromonospora sp. WMMD718]|uniref:Uncharacterized protein n=1 Tax=Micromonospora aurantiaca (nom. illeg.) TaxID=47850 RepID=A0ABQ6UG08_9ACTN|nr:MULTISPECIES: hypothetical protein [Micromonospora]KAB1112459.1 hypothetical protein F6X54_15240 [Micromonospora aurantiaca]MDG4751828.1 hypothetical protein [Micromonospora sp. WMMD718]OHX02165.1 hypothetical protein BFV98_03755 [Micromonospora sp. WMMB235]UFN91646.1 hypothetical protein LF814_16590 [Micromonospora aurantiaca]